MKKIIGITGGSGTGKSVAADVFKNSGACVLNADEIYKNIITPKSRALSEIECEFGKKVISNDGTLNRKALAKIVFGDKDKLHKLDSITHKYIIDKINKEIDAAKEALIVIDAPTLFESGLNKICSKTIGILAPKALRIKRIMARDNLTKAEATARIEAQKQDSFYIKNCDYTVTNGENLDEFINSIKDVYVEIF